MARRDRRWSPARATRGRSAGGGLASAKKRGGPRCLDPSSATSTSPSDALIKIRASPRPHRAETGARRRLAGSATRCRRGRASGAPGSAEWSLGASVDNGSRAPTASGLDSPREGRVLKHETLPVGGGSGCGAPSIAVRSRSPRSQALGWCRCAARAPLARRREGRRWSWSQRSASCPAGCSFAPLPPSSSPRRLGLPLR